MRMVKKLFVVIALFGVFLVKESYSTEAVNHRHDVTRVRLKVGMITEAEFPDNIANVTKNISSESLQIETLGNKMFLLAREILDSYIYVVTQNNFSYCLHLFIDEAEAVTHINIKKPSNAQSEHQKNKEIVNTVELMKALINDKPFRGVVGSRLPSQEIFNDGRIRMVIDEIYEFQGGVKAVVLTFENLSYKPVVVPIENVELPGLLAISVKSQMLEARPRNIDKKTINHTTKVYMVVEGTNQ